MTSGIERTLAILEAVARGGAPTHTELARALAIPKGTTSKLLALLRELGYLEVADGRYEAGPQLMALAHGVRRNGTLHRQIRPVLERLAAETGETAMLSIEVGRTGHTAGSMLVIDLVESVHPVRFVAPVGEPRPMHDATSGYVVLAFTHRSAENLTQPEDVDQVSFDAELRRIRGDGYLCRETQELTTVAAPVLDDHGRLIAAVSISGLTARMQDPRTTVWPQMRAALGAVAPMSTSALVPYDDQTSDVHLPPMSSTRTGA